MIPPKTLRELLHYNPEDGLLTWKARGVPGFDNHYANKPAGGVRPDGYFGVCIHGRRFLSHRVIWAMHYSEWPAEEIDHINGCRGDNRIENLRVVSLSENMHNKRRYKNKGTPWVGVSQRGDKWRARIRHDGKLYNLGTFDVPAAAIAARKIAEIRFGFHPNHGSELEAPEEDISWDEVHARLNELTTGQVEAA